MCQRKSPKELVASGLQIAGPVILIGSAPAIWFGGLPGGIALALFPLILVGRRMLRMPMALPGTGGLLMASALWAGVTSVAVRDWSAASPKLFGVLLGLALVYVITADPVTKAWLRLFWIGLAVGTSALVALTALFLTEWPKDKLLPFDGLYAVLPAGPRVVDHGGRLGGIGPNQIGGLLALFLPLGFALSLDSAGSSRSVRAVAALALAFALVVLLLTQSRSAYVGALVGLALVGLWRVNRSAWLRNRSTSRVVLNAAFGLALVLLVAAIAGTWLAPLDSTAETLTGRLRIWSASLVLTGDFLVSGVGPGQFPLVLKAAFPELADSVAPHIPHAHNLVLQALLDLGLPGSLALGTLIALAVRGLIATAREFTDPSVQLLCVGLGGSIVALFIFGLTDAIAPGARGGLSFWLVLGLALACGRLSRQAPAAT